MTSQSPWRTMNHLVPQHSRRQSKNIGEQNFIKKFKHSHQI